MNRILKMQIIRLFISLIPSTQKRTKFLKKHKVFDYMGDNVFFQPRLIPAEPKQIRIHNNVVVAANVTFITHDVIDKMLNNLSNNSINEYNGCIEIKDNVFIGANSTILPNVCIGSNVIIGANTLVNKDIPNNVVVGGIPAKILMSYEEFLISRMKTKVVKIDKSKKDYQKDLWDEFTNQRCTKEKI